MEKGISGVAAGTPSQENDSNEQHFFLRDICPFRPSTSKSNGCPNSTTWVFFSGPCSKRFQITRYRDKPHKTQAQAPAPIQQAHPNAEVHSFHLKEGVKGTGCLGKCDFQLATNRNREKNMNSRDEKLKGKEVVVESKKVSRDQEWFNMIQYDSISIKIVYLMTQNSPQPRLPSSFIAPANLQLGSLAQFEGQCVSHLRLEPRFFGFTSFGGRLVDADATPNLVCLGALVPGSKASFQGGIASRTPGKRLVRNLTKNVIKSGKVLYRQANRSKKNSDLFNSLNQISRQQTMYAAHKRQHIVYWRFTFPRFCEAREDHCVFAMSRSQILTCKSWNLNDWWYLGCEDCWSDHQESISQKETSCATGLIHAYQAWKITKISHPQVVSSCSTAVHIVHIIPQKSYRWDRWRLVSLNRKQLGS